MLLKMKRVEVLIFYTPPLQNHCFSIPAEGKMEAQRRLETIFRAIANGGRTARLFRELFETFLDLQPPAGERWAQPWAWKLHPVYIYIYIYIYVLQTRARFARAQFFPLRAATVEYLLAH